MAYSRQTCSATSRADPIIGLLIAVFLVKEGRRAVQEEKLCSCAACGLPPGEPSRR